MPKKYDITLNTKKTLCIQLGSRVNINEHVSIRRFPKQWSESVRHLGNPLLTLDCRYKLSMIIGYVNKFISKFGYLQPHNLIF